MSTVEQTLTEHFEHVPLAFIDDVINAANSMLYQAVSAFETFLKDHTHCPESEAEQGVHQIETLLEHAIDRNFDAFELYALRNVFHIPSELEDYILLDHHRRVDFGDGSETTDSTVDAHIYNLKKQIDESSKLTALLKSEIAQSETKLAHLEQMQQKISFLRESARIEGLFPLPETLDFIAERATVMLQSIRDLMSENKIGSLRIPKSKRAEYIQSVLEAMPNSSNVHQDWSLEEARLKTSGDFNALVESIK